jgi:hypothetical protein
MFVIRSQQSYPRFRETTDVECTLNAFRSGWMLLRDLDSFFSLERRLYDEIGKGVVLSLPKVPQEEIKESLRVLGCTLTKSSDDSDGLYDRKVRLQFIAARLSDYIGSLLQFPEVIKSKAFEDFLAYREDHDGSTSEMDQPRHELTDSTSLQWISEQMSRMIIPSSEINQVVDQKSTEENNIGRCKKDFYEFLFQGCDMDEIEISIPRRAAVTHYEYVPAGWWLVFRITTQPTAPIVQFTLSLCDKDTTEKSESCHTRSDRASTLHETSRGDSSSTQSSVLLAESISQNTRILQFSYRCEPKSSTTSLSEETSAHDLYHTDSYKVRYAMTFSNETNILRAAQLRLCALIVPHEAFKAACYAVSDQLEVEKRRQRSPLLCHVINSFHSDPVCLVVEPFFSEDFPDVDADGFIAAYGKCKSKLSNTDMETISSNIELQDPLENNEMRLQKTISLLQAKDIKNTDKIKELDNMVSELQKKLNLAEEERTEMQKEIDRLRQETSRSTTPKQCIRCGSTFHADELSSKGSKETAENEEVQVRNPNESLQAQLYHLQERRRKLLEASKQTSLSSHHTDLITKIEKAIQLIHSKIGLSNR